MIPKIFKPEDFSGEDYWADTANELFAKWIEDNSTIVYGMKNNIMWLTNKAPNDNLVGRIVLIEPIDKDENG